MKIEVLMSTYNGEVFLKEQIDSILAQEKIDVHLTIRDDGSTDRTVEILKNYESLYPSKIRVITGENLGYKKSFFELLKLAQPDYDFYAFSDQDDIWLPEKCFKAVSVLCEKQNDIAMYVSAVKICDENCKELYTNDFSKRNQSLKSIFVRYSYSGCVMVFTKQLKEMAQRLSSSIPNNYMIPSHDFLVSTLAFYYGKCYIDPKSYILHRRWEQSVTPGGKGLLNRIKSELKFIFKKKYENYYMAKLLNTLETPHLEDENKKFIDTVIQQRTSFIQRFKLIGDKKFRCGIKICDIETRFKILFGNY